MQGDQEKKSKKLFTILGSAFLLLLVVFVTNRLSVFSTSQKFRESIINNFTISQTLSVVGQPVKWTKTIKVSSINDLKHFLEVPFTASNIKISLLPQNKVKKADEVNQLINIDRQKLSELSKENSKSAASLALAHSIKNKPTFFATILNDFSRLLSTMLAAVELGDTMNNAVIDLTASSSPIADEIINASELAEASSTEVSTSTENVVSSTTPETIPSEVINTLQNELPNYSISTTTEISTTSEEAIVPESTSTATSTVSEEATSTVVVVQYETPAPVIAEATTETGKVVTVSAEDTPDMPVTDVLAFTNIPEIYKVGQEDKIKIKWTNNGNQEVTFHAYDLNGNGKLDYVEWTVPHLSTQTFEIIFISKAFELDANKEIVADIYDQVQTKDNIWTPVLDGEYVRVTFENILSDKNDNTLYARATNAGSPASIEIYPVYVQEDGSLLADNTPVATINNIDAADTYKALLTNLQKPTDIFDLKVIGNVDIDYIVDPICVVASDNALYTVCTYTSSDTFTPPSGLSSVAVLVVAGGGGGNGGMNSEWYGDGGAGGTVIYNSSYSVTAGTPVTVTVGNGGTGDNHNSGTYTAGSGGNSVFGTITATGGTGTVNTARVGGSNANYSGGTGTVWLDGGAGAGGGGNGSTVNGGVGYQTEPGASISGVHTHYAGGGGSSSGNSVAGTAVDGGGTYGVNGTANTGGGGGSTANGGSGIVIVRYLTPSSNCVAAPDNANYTVCTYTSNNTFTAPTGVSSVELLVVAGGGGGGSGATSANNGGGGGGGGLIYNSSYTVTAGTPVTVTVGNGGTANTNGGNSVFGTITATGGGKGGGLIPSVAGGNGGSGGGGAPSGATAGGAASPSGQGYAGSAGNAASPYQGGGGGGAGEIGGTDGRGYGGDGLAYSISGTSKYYAGGGGGGADTTPGIGGDGGGGTGAIPNGATGVGTANTGGGGGGGSSQGIGISGGAGGSGIVIVRYSNMFSICGNNFDYAGAIYPTVKLGTQCWFAKDLNVGTQIASTTAQGTDCSSTSTIKKYCSGGSVGNCTTYGGEYTWDQAMCGVTTEGAKGICPTGWHIPSDTEYVALTNYLGSATCATRRTGNDNFCGAPAGDRMKSAGLCQGRTPCGDSGFNALLGGEGSINLGISSVFWTSTIATNGTEAWRSGLRMDNSGVDATYYYSDHSAPRHIRCVSDSVAMSVPDAPTIGTAVAGNATATVAFTAPASNGGSVITGYTVTSSPVGGVDTNAGTTNLSHLITGLTNGTAYTFTVTATNAIGTSLASAASNSVTPSLCSVASDNSLYTVCTYKANGTFSASTGVSSVSVLVVAGGGGGGYNYHAAGGGSGGLVEHAAKAVTAGSPVSVVVGNGGNGGTSATIIGSNGGNSSFGDIIAIGGGGGAGYKVAPNNGASGGSGGGAAAQGGTGGASTQTNSGGGTGYGYAGGSHDNSTPSAGGGGAGGAGGSSATAGLGRANSISGSSVTYAAGGMGVSDAVNGLSGATNTGNGGNGGGTSTNGGNGGSGIVIVRYLTITAPGAPTIGTAVAGNATATVAFTAPASNGGSVITGYTVTSNPAGGVDSNAGSTTLSHLITGLTNDTAYTFTVTATNVIGTSTASAASNSVVPLSFQLPQNGLVGYWKLNEGSGTTATDSSVNGYTGSLINTPTWVTGKSGTSLTLNGTSQYVSVPTAANLNFGTGDFSINYWFNAPDQTVSYPAMISTYGGWNSGAFGIRYDNSGLASKVSVHWNPLGDPLISSSNTISNNAWHNVALTRSGTALSLYVDNVLQGTATAANALNLTYGGSMTMGWGPWDGSNGYFHGTMDEVSIYNRALSVSEISSIYLRQNSVPSAPTNVSASASSTKAIIDFSAPSDGGSAITGYTVTSSPAGGVDSNAGSTTLSHIITGLTNGTAYTFTVTATNAVGTSAASTASNSIVPSTTYQRPQNGLAGYWKLNDGSGTTAIDSSINVNAGTLNNSPTWITGQVGGALGFNGTNNYIRIGDKDVLNPHLGSITIAVWVKSTDTVNSQRIFAKGTNGGSQPGYSLQIYPGTGGKISLIFGTGSEHLVKSNASITDGQWKFVVGVIDRAGYMSLYINGVKQTETVSIADHSAFDMGSGTLDACIGVSCSVSGSAGLTEYTNGGIDEVSVYKRVLSASEISAMYSGESGTVSDAPTIGTAVAGDTYATINFTAPASDGGSSIAYYTATSNPGNITATSTFSPIVITGLTNGTAYTFTVTATNAVGTSSASVASNSVTPASVPSAPINVVATAGNTQATVTFSAPVSNGGSAITGYTVTSGPADGVDSNAGSTTLSHLITGLKNGTSYTFKVTATNAVGYNTSNTSNSVIPFVPNTLPIATSVNINSAIFPIILLPGTTTNVVCSGTVSDSDGYANITNVTAKLYRSGVGADAIDDNSNHYTLAGDSQCIPSNGSGNNETYTCNFPVQFYADPTDTGSVYESQNWVCQMTPSDSVGSGTVGTSTNEIATLKALDISTTINYGTLIPGQNSTGEHKTVVTNLGNISTGFNVSGNDLVCSVRSLIPVGNQEYNLNTFNYGSGTSLSGTEIDSGVNLLKPTQSLPSMIQNIYWQIAVPFGVSGICSGITSFVF